MTGSSGGELTAWEIMQKMDGGHGDEVVAILSGGSTDPVVEERGTFEVVLPASSMNLPDGGWVQLEIAGDAYFKGTAFAGPDGNVRFTVPRQRIGAVITVTLTAFTPDGNPYSTGSKNSLVEEGGETSFNVSLTDLNNPTVTYSDGMLTNETENGYKLLRYSYLANPIVYPKFSVTNPYDDGSATMTVELDGNPLTGDADTGNISNQPLSDGQHTITVTLSKPGWSSDIRIEKKILVQMKAVKAKVGYISMYYENAIGEHDPTVHQKIFILSGDDDDDKAVCCLTQTGTLGSKSRGYNTDPTNTVTLKTKDSVFYFYTNQAQDSANGWKSMGIIDKGDITRTLEGLKSDGSFYTGFYDINGNPYSGDDARSWYQFSVELTDVVYTAGTDD